MTRGRAHVGPVGVARGSKIVLAAAMLGAALAACGDAPASELDPNLSLYALVSTVDGVDFSPPLGPTPVYSGTFDPTLLARLQVVLEATGPTGQVVSSWTFDAQSSPRLVLLAPHELYFVNVPAAAYFTDPSLAYRFRALLDGREIGRSDLSDHIFTVMRYVPSVPVGVKLRLEARPAPVLSSLTPSRLLATSPTFTLTVDGGAFSSDSVIRFAGHDLATTKVSDSTLTAAVPADHFAASGRYDVSVFTPSPGGGTSASLTFTSENPIPVLGALSPASAVAGQGALVLTATGLAFAHSASIVFAGTELSTTFVSEAELRATVPAALLALAGTPAVTVQNGQPGGGVSGALLFTIANAAPSIASLSPASALRGAGALVVTIAGSGFVAGAQAALDGAALQTVFVSSTRLDASIPAASLAVAGTHGLTVANPSPSLGASGAATFTVNNAAPSLTSVAPAATMRTIGLSVTIDGSGFVSGAVASLGATHLATTYVSATRLTASIPSSAVSTVGLASLTVTSPAPTPGPSNALGFSVTELYNCTNGVMDGLETGVDCGGPYCPACIPLGSAPDHPAHACSDILFSGASTGDGLYWIDPDGGSAANAFATFCDMTTDGGGWTLVAYAGSNVAGFPRMDVDVGTFSPARRTGKASRAAVDVARRSDQMALGYSPTLAHSGALGGMTDVVAFTIPEPKRVDFGTGASNGTCTAVSAWRLRPAGSTAVCVGSTSPSSSHYSSSTASCNPADGSSHAGVWSRSLGGTYNGNFAYGLYTTEYGCNSWPNISHHWWVDSQYYNWEPSATQPWNGAVDGTTAIWLRCSANGACPTCDDGVQNQGEDGVDCGGPCAPCGPLNTMATALPTCSDILTAGRSRGDGLYYVDPDGNPANAFLSHCDMTTDGGGWTLAAYAGSNAAGFPRMDVDVGTFNPSAPSGKASHGALLLTRRSREMALAYTPDLSSPSALADSTDAVSFVIPSPSAVDLVTSTDRGTCTAVSAKRLRPAGSTAACIGTWGTANTAISDLDCNPRGGAAHAGVWSRSLGGTYNGTFAYGLYSTEAGCDSWPNVSHHWWVDSQYYNWEPSATQPWNGSVNGSTSVWLRGDVSSVTCFDGVRDDGETGLDCGGPCAPCPTCFDGLQNQDETAIDCGGVCGPCPLNAQATAPASCTALLLAGQSQGTGIYWIDPDGGSTSNAFKTYCDMTTDGGGWTLVAFAGSNEAGFPRMDVDVGTFHPWLRSGKASRSAVLLAQGSTEMALAYSPTVASSASLAGMSEAIAFTIPDPANVDLSTTNSGSCIGVEARRLLPSGATAVCLGASGQTQSSAVNCGPADRSAHVGLFSRSLGGTYSAGFGYGLFSTETGCGGWPSVSTHFFVDTALYGWQPPSVTFPATVNGSTAIWVRGDVAGALNTRASALATCRAIRDAGMARGDGLYWIDPDGGSTSNAHKTYCDMTTDGGGWTLIAYAGNREAGFPRMDSDVGTFLPAARLGKASKGALLVARASSELALAYSPTFEASGNLGSTTDAVTFTIPTPSLVDFAPTANSGTCVAVSARRLRPIGSTAACVGSAPATAISTSNCNQTGNAYHAGVWTRSLGGTYGGVFAYGLYATEWSCNSWPNVSHHWWVDSQFYNWEPSATQIWNGAVDGTTTIWAR